MKSLLYNVTHTLLNACGNLFLGGRKARDFIFASGYQYAVTGGQNLLALQRVTAIAFLPENAVLVVLAASVDALFNATGKIYACRS